MKVILAEAMGLCFGVRDALEAARAVLAPAEVTVFGQLVHNSQVTRELAGRGFTLLDEGVRQTNRVQTAGVLITAHGVSNRQRAALEAQGKKIVDTTCPLVRRAHREALTLAREGYFVVIIGKRGHVEVEGLTGDLCAGRFAVIEKEAEVVEFGEEKIGVMAQTTAVGREVNAMVARIGELNRTSAVKWVDTICRPTRDRQAALERLLKEVDVLVVVGGRHSNNTRQLVGRGREVGVRVVHVEGAEELMEGMFEPWEVVGLTAGTSTLPETVEAVRGKLVEFHMAGAAKI